MNHGNRRAPETLAREQPVAQAVNNLTFAGAGSLNQLGSLRNSLCLRKPGQLTGVNEHPIARSGDTRLGWVFLALNIEHRHDRQVEFLGEVKVALIVRRHRHNSAGTIIGKHVIGSPHRQLCAVQRVNCVSPSKHTSLLTFGRLAVNIAERLNLLAIVL